MAYKLGLCEGRHNIPDVNSCDAFDYYMASVQDSMQASENSDCLYNSDRQSSLC